MLATIVLLDLKGYSELPLPAKRAFFLQALPKIAEKCFTSEARNDIQDANTWGDAILAVFSNVREGANFALRILDFIRKEPWPDYPELAKLGIRIAIHALCCGGIPARRCCGTPQRSNKRCLGPCHPHEEA